MRPRNHAPRSKHWMTVLLALAVIPACSTSPREFQTPVGPRSADQLTGFKILGVISRGTSTLRRATVGPGFEQDVIVNVPPGTDLIVPAMRGWYAGFGHTAPEDLSSDPASSTYTWYPAEHSLGLVGVNVAVMDINAIDTSTFPPSQTAEIRITAVLSDKAGDDEWWCLVTYNLVCLGRETLTVERPIPG